MPEFLTLKEAFLKHKKEGNFIFLEEVNLEKIKSMMRIAESDIDAAESIKKSINKQSNQWNGVYKLYYDALHVLAESFLQVEKIKVDNHQGLFAYLCEKHAELELSWEFFEKIRTKRNGIHYYGRPIQYEDWKEVELQFMLYIKKLKEELKIRIANHQGD